MSGSMVFTVVRCYTCQPEWVCPVSMVVMHVWQVGVQGILEEFQAKFKRVEPKKCRRRKRQKGKHVKGVLEAAMARARR